MDWLNGLIGGGSNSQAEVADTSDQCRSSDVDCAKQLVTELEPADLIELLGMFQARENNQPIDRARMWALLPTVGGHLMSCKHCRAQMIGHLQSVLAVAD